MSSPSGHHRASWLTLSILYVVLFTYPLLQVFNRNTLVFGIPLLILYLLLGWLFSICVIYRFTRHLGRGPGKDGPDHVEEHERP